MWASRIPSKVALLGFVAFWTAATVRIGRCFFCRAHEIKMSTEQPLLPGRPFPTLNRCSMLPCYGHSTADSIGIGMLNTNKPISTRMRKLMRVLFCYVLASQRLCLVPEDCALSHLIVKM